MMLPSERDVSFDMLTPLLAQGSRPPGGDWLRRNGFSVVVLAAIEYQPPEHAYPGVFVVRAPIDDAARLPTDGEWALVERAAVAAATLVRRSKKVYISCHKGINRSGLVMGRTLTLLTGRSGRWAADFVRSRRGGALSNVWFRATLDQIPATGRIPARATR